jgi:hypothetical protein
VEKADQGRLGTGHQRAPRVSCAREARTLQASSSWLLQMILAGRRPPGGL